MVDALPSMVFFHILNFPDADTAFATSVALNKLTGIAFTTSPVVEVEQFDRLIAKVKDL